MTTTYETPDGWQQHNRMSKSSGYLDAFRNSDFTAFVDIIRYKPHMDAQYVVEYLEAIEDMPRTTTVEEIDCADESEAWNTAIELMEEHA